MRNLTWMALVLALLLAVAACGDDDDDNNDDSPADDDDASPDDDDDDDNDNDDTPGDGDWDGVTITAVIAPEREKVRVTLSGDPGDNAAADPAIYEITSDFGALAVTGASFDAGTKQATLTTAPQKLGVTYALTINPNGYTGAPLTGDFLAADTAKFWVYDFGLDDRIQITANRAGVGENCVVYIEQGQSASDVAETITVFDEEIFPIETAMYHSAPDLDGNGKITLLGLDGGGWYGGYFDPINSVTDEQAMDWWGIHSNGMELVHINTVSGSMYPYNVVPHEFQHLLYQERHGWQNEYWEYHNEGLAETAVHAVFGANQGAVDFFLWDPDGLIGAGLSLVHWTYALYENYVQAYLYWMYLAGRLGGIDELSNLFDLDTGNPDEVEAMIAAELGSDMPTTVLENEIAVWVQQAGGPYSFSGLLSFAPASAPTAAGGTTSLNLEPYGGAFFALSEDEVSYPGTQGAHIVYAGIDADGNVDLTEPFDVDGGALLAYNTSTNTTTWPDEHSGPDISALRLRSVKAGAAISPAWDDPPPFAPDQVERRQAWRNARLARMLGY
jgi:hypothetical protein